MTDEPIRYIKMEPEFLEIVSRIHLETIATRWKISIEFHEDEEEGALE